jgi:hypothetical protein
MSSRPSMPSKGEFSMVIPSLPYSSRPRDLSKASMSKVSLHVSIKY